MYHLGVHAGWREALFRRDSDRDIYFRLLDSVVEELGWDCIAYCLLTTHLHLLVQTPLPNLSAGMQRVNSQYAQGFNRRYGRNGHVVESRFWHELVEGDRQLLATARYIALNPVAAGVCRAPEDWPWSSYRATAGYVEPPRLLRDGALLGLLDDDRARAQLEWREVVAAAVARGEHRKPREHPPRRTRADGASRTGSRV